MHDDTEHHPTAAGGQVGAAPPLTAAITRPARHRAARRRPFAVAGSLGRAVAARVRSVDQIGTALSSPAVRRALRSRVLALLVAALVATAVAGRVGAADHAREQWGEQVRVAVMRRDLPAGGTVTSSDAHLVSWPAALVPADALRRLPDRGRLAAAVVDGEVLVDSRLAHGASGELSAQLAPGEVAVQLPPSPTAPRVAPGDRVDLVAAADAPASDLSGIASTLRVEVVASGARVIGTDHEGVSLAVRRAQAERAAGAALSGVVALVVLGDD